MFQEDFYRSTNNTEVLSQCLKNKDVLSGGKQWLKRLKTLIHQNFKKVRISNQPKKCKVQELLSNNKSDDEITEEIYLRNKSKIIEQIGEMSDHTGNMTRLKMWKVKNKVCPKNGQSVPVAKMDKSGNLVRNRVPDLEIVVYPGILVPRIYLSLQNIFKDFSV